MRISPENEEFRRRLGEIPHELGPGCKTVWVGFDYRPHLVSHGPLLNEGDLLVSKAFNAQMSWRACLFQTDIDVDSQSARAVVYDVSGDRVYGMSVLYRNRHSVWATPDPYLERLIKQLRKK